MAVQHQYVGQFDQDAKSCVDLDRSRTASRAIYASSMKPAVSPVTLLKNGDAWTISGCMAAPLWLKHSKGLTYLSTLIENPGAHIHVLTLIGAEHRPGDAGSALDNRARQEYRARFEDLKNLLVQAERFGDTERAVRIQDELDLLGRELRRAVGLGGKERRAVSGVERARINVQRCIKDAITRISKHNAGLGRYLAATVRTGTTCAFTPL